MGNCPLSEKILNYEDYFNEPDEGMIQNILDHRKVILENSTLNVLTSYESNRYKWFLDAYLKSLQLPTSMSWIVLLINKIPNMQSFKNVTYLYIPDTTFLMKIVSDYKSSLTS